jgi:hypothetical protein
VERGDVNAVAVPRGAVFTLQSHEIEPNWDVIEPYLLRLERRFPYDINTALLREDLGAARKQLWGYHDSERVVGVCITEIQAPVCWIRAASADLTSPEKVDATLAEIEKWARSLGCDRVRLAGRGGWKRRLRDYRQIAVTMEKVLCK